MAATTTAKTQGKKGNEAARRTPAARNEAIFRIETGSDQTYETYGQPPIR